MDNILQADNINAFWDKNPVLQNVSISVKSGEFVCLTGPNGCGKSTLLSILSGIYEDITNTALKITESSKITYNERSITKIKRKDLAQQISYLTQSETSAWNYDAKDIILTGRFPYLRSAGFYTDTDYKIVNQIIQQLHIEDIAKKQVYSLSGGEYQKIRIARCLAQEPDILLLDEPVANLDFSYQAELMALLKDLAHKHNKGVLIVIHDINTAIQYADRVVLLPKGQNCISGTPQEVINRDNLELTYPNTNFGIFSHPVFNCPQVYIKQI